MAKKKKVNKNKQVDRNKKMSELALGAADGRRWTLQEIGDKYGISKNRVSQILKDQGINLQADRMRQKQLEIDKYSMILDKGANTLLSRDLSGDSTKDISTMMKNVGHIRDTEEKKVQSMLETDSLFSEVSDEMFSGPVIDADFTEVDDD